MKSIKIRGGLVLVLLIALFAFGCGGRGDDITNPPPPGDGGGNNPPQYTGAVIMHKSAGDGDSTTIYIPGTTCEVDPSDSRMAFYLGGIYPTWDETYQHMKGAKFVKDGFTFATFYVPPNTPYREVTLDATNGNTSSFNCSGYIVKTDPAALPNSKYGIDYTRYTRQDNNQPPASTYLDVLSGSTDSTVNANNPVRLSSPHPGWWHQIVWTSGANLRNVTDQDRTHYTPTLGGALFTPDPVGYWRDANTMVFDYRTPPDQRYGNWYPLWISSSVGTEPRAGEAWVIRSSTWNGNIVHPIEWVNGQPRWFTP